VKRSMRISDKLWQQILPLLPISTVDLVVTRWNDSHSEFLLAKRAIEPYKEQWFVPGGRMEYGETFRQAVKRQTRRELGFVPEEFELAGCFPWLNPLGEEGVRKHTIMHIFVVYLPDGARIRPNAENESVRWFRRIAHRWPKAVRDALQLARFDY
jgi:colanic acid biosynthesis protein WcaH